MSTQGIDEAAGAALRVRRSLAGLTQKDIADRVGVGQSTVAKWERGDVPMRLRDAIAICLVLGTTLGDLWDEPAIPDRYQEGVRRGIELSMSAIARAAEKVIVP